MEMRSATCLNVTDLAASLAWYKALGFKVTNLSKGDDGKPTWAALTFADADVWLVDAAGNDTPDFKEWMSTPLGAGILLIYAVPDVDPIWKKAQKLRAKVEDPVTDSPEGRMFTLNDPDGYVVNFWSIPKPKKTAKKGVKAAKKPAAKKAARTRSRR